MSNSRRIRNELAQTQLTKAEKNILLGLAAIQGTTVAEYLRALISQGYHADAGAVDKWVSENSNRTTKTPMQKTLIRQTILERYANGETAMSLAEEFGYTRGGIYAMVQRSKPICSKPTSSPATNAPVSIISGDSNPMGLNDGSTGETSTALEDNPLNIDFE